MRAALAVIWMLLAATPAHAACRQALALGLDVSGSVDMWEYRLQLDGLALALLDREVQAAFLAMPQAPVRVMVYEWSGIYHQRIVIGWTTVDRADVLNGIALQLRATEAEHVDDPSTSIGASMRFGAGALRQQPDCWQKTLDISGDGPANIGTHPGELTAAELGDIVINGLVIGPDGRANTTKNLDNVKSLESYYRSFVLRGPGAFAEVAVDYHDFTQAMKRKLLRELEAPVLSRAGAVPAQ